MNSVCRTCLTLGDLSPIFPNRQQHTLYTTVLLMTTGLKIELDDGLPQCICEGCTNLINSALRLRDQSHHAQQILLENGFQKAAGTIVVPDEVDEKVKDESGNGRISEEAKAGGGAGEREGYMKREFKIEIDLTSAAALLQESNSKKTAVKRKPKRRSPNTKANPKKKETDLGKDADEEMGGGETGGVIALENVEVKLETDGEDKPLALGRVKRKCVRPVDASLIASEGGNTKERGQAKGKRKYVRKSDKEKLEQKGRQRMPRLTRKESMEKYGHLMETKYEPGKPIVCRACKKQFAQLSTFLPHAKRHTVGEFVCEICARRFHTRHTLLEHGMRWHGAERRLCCQQCDYRAIDQYQLKNHRHKVHTGQRPFVCDLCGSDFICKSNIRQHMRKHYGVKNVQCDRCPSMFNSRSSLASHTAKAHRLNFAYLCYVCPRRYTGRCAVRRHIIRQHGIPRHLQGPISVLKWNKNEPPPPDIAYRTTS